VDTDYKAADNEESMDLHNNASASSLLGPQLSFAPLPGFPETQPEAPPVTSPPFASAALPAAGRMQGSNSRSRNSSSSRGQQQAAGLSFPALLSASAGALQGQAALHAALAAGQMLQDPVLRASTEADNRGHLPQVCMHSYVKTI
jgi:uncharacterized protein YfiM (DUF2279 family)